MSKQREALEMALDTLRGWIGIDEWIWPVTAKETCKKNSLEAITAIREALAEPEQKPVAYVDKNYGIMRINDGIDLPIGAKLYTAPPARKPLTIEEITAIVQSMSAYTWDGYMLARLIEKAHGIGK